MNDLLRPAMYDAWHGIVPVSRGRRRRARRAGRHRRPGLRDRRHVRARPRPAAAARRRARGDPRRGCVWFGDELHLQRPAAGRRGAGRWRALVGDPRRASTLEALWAGETVPDWLGVSRPTPDPPPPRPQARRRARAALWFEQLWPAVWPALGVLGAYLLPRPARRAGHPAALAAAAAARRPSLWPPPLLLWRGLRRVGRGPTPPTADRRLERATGLRAPPARRRSRDRPAAPTPGGGGALAGASGAAARRRSRACASARRGPAWPRATAGRCAAACSSALVACAGRSPGRRRRRGCARAVTPGLPAGPAAPGTEVQAWVTPPAYTGLPPVSCSPGRPSQRARRART